MNKYISTVVIKFALKKYQNIDNCKKKYHWYLGASSLRSDVYLKVNILLVFTLNSNVFRLITINVSMCTEIKRES